MAQRCTIEVCRRRSRTRHPGQVGTSASGPAVAAASARALPAVSTASMYSVIFMFPPAVSMGGFSQSSAGSRTQFARGAPAFRAQ